MQSKIKTEHLLRDAYIYIRQSSMTQVKEHQESQRVQYRLAERAVAFGWPEPVIMDTDLGRSGSGSSLRPGFEQLLAAICAKSVGAVFCAETSRLARNNREWSQLTDFCAIVHTLLIDLDGIYDPSNVSDRVYLGMKGTMSEYELGIFRQRAQHALEEKAQRGELYFSLPAGYILTPDNRCEMDPNQRVKDAFELIFKMFQQLGSANSLVQWLRSENIELPCKNPSSRKNGITWKLPTNSTVSKILKNPIYAGAYAYGRTETRIRIVDEQPIKSKGHELPMDRWKVLHKDHHQAYITWQDYMTNQKRLEQNQNLMTALVKGAIKRGPALLIGLLRCQRCSRKFRVRYRGAGSNIPRYYCRGEEACDRQGNCISFSGTRIEALIETELLAVVQPQAIAAAQEAERLYAQQQGEKTRTIENALVQAEYEAHRRFEQYNLIDPKNRLVAQTLEDRWNEALQKAEKLKFQLEKLSKVYKPISAKQRETLYKLAEDLPQAWHDPKTDVTIKKRILQTLIKEIMINLTPDERAYVVSIHWAGGRHSQYHLKRIRPGERPDYLHPETETIIGGLAEVVPDQEIARILNLVKIKTAGGKSWIAARVKAFRHKHRILTFDPRQYEKKGWVNLSQAAEILKINPTQLLRLIKANVLPARQVVKYGPWIIEKEHLKQPAVQTAIVSTKKGNNIPVTNNLNQLTL